MPSEADTCRKFIAPKPHEAGWDTDPHSIAEQRYFTAGRIVVRGSKAERKRGIPDEVYGTPDIERKVALLKRTEAIARRLADFLKKTGRFAKTIVFCVDQEHASEMRADRLSARQEITFTTSTGVDE